MSKHSQAPTFMMRVFFLWMCLLGTSSTIPLSSEPATCKGSLFQCSENMCIDKTWVCDGDRDCRDGSDEDPLLCAQSCASEQFTCANGKCIQQDWKCDGDDDCGDQSDERECRLTTCEASLFQCRDSGACIMTTWTCDGDRDCRDGSDEDPQLCDTQISCGLNEFLCLNDGYCIHQSLTCDDDYDCQDKSDELGCPPSPPTEPSHGISTPSSASSPATTTGSSESLSFTSSSSRSPLVATRSSPSTTIPRGASQPPSTPRSSTSPLMTTRSSESPEITTRSSSRIPVSTRKSPQSPTPPGGTIAHSQRVTNATRGMWYMTTSPASGVTPSVSKTTQRHPISRTTTNTSTYTRTTHTPVTSPVPEIASHKWWGRTSAQPYTTDLSYVMRVPFSLVELLKRNIESDTELKELGKEQKRAEIQYYQAALETEETEKETLLREMRNGDEMIKLKEEKLKLEIGQLQKKREGRRRKKVQVGKT